MGKKVLNRSMLLALLLATVTLGGCSKWENNFAKAKAKAEKNDRNIICVVTGSSWNSRSGAFKANIVDSKIFYRQAKDSWVLLNVDLKDKQALPVELSLFNIDFDDDFPAVFLLSQEGYYLTKVKSTKEIATPTNLFEALNEVHLEYEGMDGFMRKIRTASGPDKSIAINNFYFSTPSSYRRVLLPLVEELLRNDPNNKSGVVGLFQVEKAYLESFNLAARKDYDGIVKLFMEAAEQDFVESKDAQNAYYTAAYILSVQASAEMEDRVANSKRRDVEVDFQLILDLLNKAYDADPNDDFALQILDVIDSIKKASLLYEMEHVPAEHEKESTQTEETEALD